MLGKLKFKLALWALKITGIDPSLVMTTTQHGAVVEVTVRDERVWVNIDGTCRFRATATSHVVVDDGLEDDIAVRISRGRK